MRRVLSYVAATVVGLGLFTVPFLQYALGSGHSHATGPHSDHGARHGGHLVMLHDYHLELVVHSDFVELYVSDALRRPLRPIACTVAFDGGPSIPCDWRSHRSVVSKPIDARSGLYQLSVDDRTPLTLKFP